MKVKRNNILLETSPMTGADIQRLLNAIVNVTGYQYGYLPIRIFDTGIETLELTLNRQKNVKSSDVDLLSGTIRGWMMGAGFSLYFFRWEPK